MVVDWGDCRGRRVSRTRNHVGPGLLGSFAGAAVVVVVRRASALTVTVATALAGGAVVIILLV